MATVEDSTCPRCGAGPGSLAIRVGDPLRVAPLGSHCLAGAQVKFAARPVPVLVCRACGLCANGAWDDDGRHVTFTPPPGP